MIKEYVMVIMCCYEVEVEKFLGASTLDQTTFVLKPLKKFQI